MWVIGRSWKSKTKEFDLKVAMEHALDVYLLQRITVIVQP